jgi:uncharacterized membrane protein
MSDAYGWLKLLHVLSAALLFGTGLGTAFHMWLAHRSGDLRAIAAAARSTVLADWLFTAPAVLLQPATGLLLAERAGLDLAARWLLLVYALYLVAGACWLPVVWLQLRVRTLAAAAVATGRPLPPAYRRCMRAWFWLGWPAFAAMLAIYALMVMRPEL